jgi:chemotaxis response regulator CheB
MTDSDKAETVKSDLVVVGSSAGGVGALSTLVSTLSKSFPAPIVLTSILNVPANSVQFSSGAANCR